MAITPLGADMDIIARLSDEPNDVDGIPAAALKSRFDEAGNTIKGYINGTLIAEVDAELASLEQEMLEKIDRKIVDAGNVPSGGGDGQALVKRSGIDNDIGWASISVIPVGGSAGQVLTKRSSTDGDVVFQAQEASSVYIAEATAAELELNPVTGRNVDEGLLAAQPKTGDILMTARTDLGDNWLLCNGDWFNPEDYPELCSLFPPDPFKVITINAPTDVGLVYYSATAGAWLYLTTDGRNVYYTTGASFKAWQPAPYRFPEAVTSIIYENGYWCAASRSSATVYCSASIDSASWTAQSVGITPGRMKFLNNTWIVSNSASGTVSYRQASPVGEWSTLNTQLSNVYDFDFGNGYFTFSGLLDSTGNISYTPSLSVTPTRQTLSSTGPARAVIYAGTIWYCIAGDSSPTYYYRSLTPNGEWTAVMTTSPEAAPTAFVLARKGGVDYCVNAPALNYLTSAIRYKAVSELVHNSAYLSFTAPEAALGREGGDGIIASSGDTLILASQNRCIMASPLQLPTVAVGVNSYIKGK